MLLLSLLCEEDMYGYQLSQTIKKRSSEIISFPQGSLYPILYKLTDEKYITSYEERIMGQRIRKIYYHIEEKGIDYLKYIKAEYQAVNDGISKILSYKEINSDN